MSLRRTTEAVMASYGGEGTEFRFAALAHLKETGPFGEIWQVAGLSGLHPLFASDCTAREIPA